MGSWVLLFFIFYFFTFSLAVFVVFFFFVIADVYFVYQLSLLLQLLRLRWLPSSSSANWRKSKNLQFSSYLNMWPENNMKSSVSYFRLMVFRLSTPHNYNRSINIISMHSALVYQRKMQQFIAFIPVWLKVDSVFPLPWLMSHFIILRRFTKLCALQPGRVSRVLRTIWALHMLFYGGIIQVS